MKRIILILSLSALMFPAFSQQDAQFTHFFFNNQTFNPAATGINDQICFGLTGRQQWLGFIGAPQTGAFNFSMPFAKQNGIGLTAIYDKLGASNDVNVKASYSFHVPLGNGRKLGIGVDAGIINKGITGEFTAVDDNDPNLVNAKGSAMKPDIGAGLYYKSPNLYFGVSSQKLMQSSVNIGSSITHIRRHYYITGGYNYQMNSMWVLKPSFLFKTDGTAPSFDINTLVEYNQSIWLGASYRYQDALAGMIGYQIPDKGIRIGYSYDFTTNGLREPAQGKSTGSHEIYLGFCMKPPVPPKPPKYIDVTWL